MTLVAALGVEDARLIALCGAGGKTTLMLALAREFVAGGERVLLTTTTKIATAEAAGPWPVIYADDARQIFEKAREALRHAGRDQAAAVIAVSGETSSGEKLLGLAPEFVSRLRDEPCFDRILVEADGAAQRPLKAPADHEPVIPRATDALIMVAGLNGLGVPLSEENVFRHHIWARRTGLAPAATVSAGSLAHMVLDERGLAKGCPEQTERILFMNRADAPHGPSAARRVMRALAEAPARRPHRAVCGWLLPEPTIVDIAVLRAPVD